MEKETAMKILKELHDKSLFAERTALETIIPELKKSEDEKIREELLDFLENVFYLGKNAHFDRWEKSDCSKWIAWLEKQDVQKPTSDIKYKVSANGSLSIVNGQPFDYEHATITQKDFAPKPTEWSEEDENYLQSAENACEYQYGKNTSTILWLKHLKDRIGE